jgi:mono/diheme cytochrome c family protein
MKRLTVIFAVLLTLLSGLVITFAPERVVGAVSDRGKTLYDANCAECHGTTGKGDGPQAAALGSQLPDFTSPKFWQGNAAKKIGTTVSDGHGAMPSVNLKADEIKAITDYMSGTFKK